jgi:hypothetical protein
MKMMQMPFAGRELKDLQILRMVRLLPFTVSPLLHGRSEQSSAEKLHHNRERQADSVPVSSYSQQRMRAKKPDDSHCQEIFTQDINYGDSRSFILTSGVGSAI